MGAPLLAFRDLITNALAAVRATRTVGLRGLALALAAGGGGAAGILATGGVLGFLVGTLAGQALVLAFVGMRLRRPRARLRPASESPTAARTPIARSPPPSLILWAAYASYPLTHFLARHLVLARFGAAHAGELEAGLELSGIVALLLGPSTALYLAPAVNRRSRAGEKGRVALQFLGRPGAGGGPAVAARAPVPARWPSGSFSRRPSKGAAGFLVLLVAGQALRVLAGVFHALLIGLGDVRMYGLLVAVGQLSFGALAYAWGPADGPAGVALAFLVSNAGPLRSDRRPRVAPASSARTRSGEPAAVHGVTRRTAAEPRLRQRPAQRSRERGPPARGRGPGGRGCPPCCR